MITGLLAVSILAVSAGIVAFARTIDSSAQPVRIRVEEVDHPAAKRAGARRR